MTKDPKEFIDELTAIYNRRYLHMKVKEEIEGLKRYQIPLSIILVDLDHFKNVNDTYGHLKGDEVLKEFGEFLRSSVREVDVVIRYGGDEFIILSPHTNFNQAVKISERILVKSQKCSFADMRLTISIGIGAAPENGKTWEDIFGYADRNLYTAKRKGRNRIGFFEAEEMELNLPTTELIGRDSKIDRVKNLIDETFVGKGSAVFINGEAGIGKTRLVDEIARNSVNENIQFLRGNSYATTNAIPYYPFREVVRVCLEIGGKDILKDIPDIYKIELAKLVPELATLLKGIKKDVAVLDKCRLFDCLRIFFEKQCKGKPLLIFLDDIHWADNLSLELLQYLIKVLKKQPVCFLITYRIEEKGAFLSEILHLMGRENLYEELVLSSFDFVNTSKMLTAILNYPSPVDLTDYIFQKTGGNPFFIEELVKSVKANNVLVWDKEEWVFKRDVEISVPLSIGDTIMRKLDSVDEEARVLLDYAAVIGREFDFSLLKEVSGMNEGHLLDLLDKILNIRLLKEKEGERFYFAEDVIRQVIYQKIIKIKLKRYHQSVGEKLLEAYKDRTNEIAEELAHHFFKGGDKEQGMKYSIIAGDLARVCYANKQAIKFYNQALAFVQDKDKKVEILMKIGDIDTHVGDYDKALKNFQEALRISPENPVIYYRISIILMRKGEYRQASIYNRKAFKKCDDPQLRNKLDISMTWISRSMGKYSAAEKKVLNILKRLKKDDKQGISTVYSALGLIYGDLGEIEKSLQYFDKAMKIKTEINDKIGILAIINNRAGTYLYSNEYQKSLNEVLKYLSLCKEVGSKSGIAQAYANSVLVYRVLGDYDKVEQNLRHSSEIAELINETPLMQHINFEYGLLEYDRGNFQKSLQYFLTALNLAKKLNSLTLETAVYRAICETYWESGDYDKAFTYLNKAYQFINKIEDKSLIVKINILKAEKEIYFKRLKKAVAIIQMAIKLAQKIKHPEIEMKCYITLGKIYASNPKKAELFFNKVYLFAQKTKAKPMLGDVLYEWGFALLKLKKRRQGIHKLKRAQSIFEEIGCTRMIRKTNTILK